jgi:hypothetical protein
MIQRLRRDALAANPLSVYFLADSSAPNPFVDWGLVGNLLAVCASALTEMSSAHGYAEY